MLSTTILVSSLNRLIPKNNSNSKLFLLEDFNFSGADWQNFNSQTNRGSFRIFCDFLNKHNLTQTITEATHEHGKILDLVITSNPLNIINVTVGEPFSQKCDHYKIDLKINIMYAKSFERPPMYNFYSSDYTKINNFLSLQPWEEIFKTAVDVDEMYSRFTDVVHQAFLTNLSKIRKKNKTRYPKNIRDLLLRKKILYHKSKTDPSFKSDYKNIAKCYKNAVKTYMKSYEEKVMRSSNKNMFYSYVKNKLKSPSYLPPLFNSDGSITLDPQDKANALNSMFSKVFSPSTSNPTPLLHPWKSDFETMTSFSVTTDDIRNAIQSLKNTVSRTPDGLPCLFFKKTITNIVKPLQLIFNQSLLSGKLPEVWKQALVVPIFKKGRRNNPENYRPVSLTSVACRILEKIIHTKINIHLSNNNLLSNFQHGFLNKRSTLTQQILFFDQLTKLQSKKQNCHAIYLDFSKAFDKISHVKLIHVLSHFKICNNIISWITSFLKNRSQRTVVEGALSDSSPVTSGVPQGSVLGPMLFLLYLESLLTTLNEKCPNTHVFAFADDIKLLSQDHFELQRALSIVENWSNCWNLCLQPNKSEHLHFNFSRSSIALPPFLINHNSIPQTNTVRDLGITLSANFKWTPHISKITAKANVLCYNIIRSFKSPNILLYTNLFKTYVRPLLEFNTVIWNPHLLSDIKRVESIQRRFTRLVCQKNNIKFNCYEDRLKIMKLDTLETRRIRFDLIYMHKILNGAVDINFKEHFKINLASQAYGLRGHKFKLQLPKYSGSTVRNRFFSERVVPIWNALPKRIAESPSINSFKTELLKFDIGNIYANRI